MDAVVVIGRWCALAMLALAACYQPTIAPCHVRCSDYTSCPSGFVCDTDQYCRPAGVTSSCDEILGDALPIDMFDPACVGVVCDDPEAPTCTGGKLRVHARPGTCMAGTCSYPFADRTCVTACAGMNCVGG